MFSDCSNLTSLDLSNFNTSKVQYMEKMFYGCKSLSSLDLSNFDTSKVQRLYKMFEGCKNLEYINLKNFNEKNLVSYHIYDVFKYVPDNIVICINEDNINKILSQIKTVKCYVIDCLYDWKLVQNKMDNYSRECILTCYNKYEYNGKCLDNCTNGYYIDNIYNNNRCKCELDKCFSCPDTALSRNLCLSCNEHFYPKENDPLYTGIYFNCYKEIKGYYIDLNDSLFKKCFYTCKTCEIKGDNITHNCLKCNSNYNYSFQINISNYFNCYNHSIYDDTPDFTTNSLIISDTVILNETTSINLSSFLTYEYEYLNETSKFEVSTFPINESYLEETYKETSKIDVLIIGYFNDSNYTAEEINEKIYEQIVDFIENFDMSKGDEKIVEGKDNYSFHLTTLDKELDVIEGKNNNTNKFSKIDLGECENILKEKYNLEKNISLLILKLEKLSNKSSERNLQYEIYEPINKTKLNLSLCKEVQIDIYVPVVLSENLEGLYNELKDLGYDLFDINSDFYQDICTPYKSTNGTDVLLSDRVDTYYNNEETQCQPNCEFSDYSLDSQYLKCECDIQNSEINFDNNNDIGSKSIYKSFFDVLKFSNYKVIKCYKLAFSLNIFKIKTKEIL